VGNSTQVLLKI